MAYACVYIPEFPIVSWLRSHANASAHLEANALAVFEGKAPLQRIVSINGHAKSQGCWIGMSKVQAETNGAVLFHERSIAEEEKALEEIRQVAGTFSPQVEIVAGPSNQYAGSTTLGTLMMLDQSRTETIFGSACEYAERLKTALRVAGFNAHIAITPNAQASLLLAQSRAGLICAGKEETAKHLAPLPICLLPCDSATLSVFARWGIRTLGELAALPVDALISRIGQQGARLRRLALGVEEYILSPDTEAFVLEVESVLDSPLEQLDSLLFVLSPMLEQLIRKAGDRAYALRSVCLILELEKADPYRLRVRPAVPTQNRELLLKLLSLELQVHPPGAAILKVSLSGEPTKPATAQRGLFQAQFPEPEKLDLLVSRLRSIAGEDNVGSPALSNSHSGDAYSLICFEPNSAHVLPDRQEVSPRLALRRLRPPEVTHVRVTGDVPSMLYWRGKRCEIVEAKGPWESSGYWWDGRYWASKEWDILVGNPLHAVRLRHEMESNSWSIAGIYD